MNKSLTKIHSSTKNHRNSVIEDEDNIKNKKAVKTKHRKSDAKQENKYTSQDLVNTTHIVKTISNHINLVRSEIKICELFLKESEKMIHESQLKLAEVADNLNQIKEECSTANQLANDADDLVYSLTEERDEVELKLNNIILKSDNNHIINKLSSELEKLNIRLNEAEQDAKEKDKLATEIRDFKLNKCKDDFDSKKEIITINTKIYNQIHQKLKDDQEKLKILEEELNASQTLLSTIGNTLGVPTNVIEIPTNVIRDNIFPPEIEINLDDIQFIPIKNEGLPISDEAFNSKSMSVILDNSTLVIPDITNQQLMSDLLLTFSLKDANSRSSSRSSDLDFELTDLNNNIQIPVLNNTTLNFNDSQINNPLLISRNKLEKQKKNFSKIEVEYKHALSIFENLSLKFEEAKLNLEKCQQHNSKLEIEYENERIKREILHDNGGTFKYLDDEIDTIDIKRIEISNLVNISQKNLVDINNKIEELKNAEKSGDDEIKGKIAKLNNQLKEISENMQSLRNQISSLQNDDDNGSKDKKKKKLKEEHLHHKIKHIEDLENQHAELSHQHEKIISKLEEYNKKLNTKKNSKKKDTEKQLKEFMDDKQEMETNFRENKHNLEKIQLELTVLRQLKSKLIN